MQGLCPFHEESTASWNGNRETGLWKCFGCLQSGNADQFAERMGDTEWEPEKRKVDNPWTESTVIATYDYHDLAGRLLYQVVRFDPKDFRIRQPDGQGGWLNHGRDIRRVLFNLPNLSASETIYLVEGEKDCLSLMQRQLTATTIAGGVNGTVTPEMLKPLHNKKIVIFPDNDKPGRAFAQKMADMLADTAVSVRIVEIPGLLPKQDVSWWLDNGHTLEELDGIIKTAPIIGGIRIWEPSLTPFSDYTEKQTPFLWYPYIPIGRITILEGDPGQGKSWFSMAVAASATLGSWYDLLPGEENWTEPCNVIYVTSEDDPEDTIAKRLRIVQADKNRVFYLNGKAKGEEGAIAIDFSDLPIISRAITKIQAKLLIIDPIQAYMPSGSDMNKADQVRPIMVRLQQMAKEHECAILLLRHLSKGNKDNSLYRGMGSIDWTAAARSVLFCGERRELRQQGPLGTRKRVAVTQIKNNIAPFGPAIEFDLAHDEFLWFGTSDVTPEQIIASSSLNLDTLNQVKDFLKSAISSEGTMYETIQRQARKQGINLTHLEVAKSALGITLKEIYGQWRWMLPENARNCP